MPFDPSQPFEVVSGAQQPSAAAPSTTPSAFDPTQPFDVVSPGQSTSNSPESLASKIIGKKQNATSQAGPDDGLSENERAALSDTYLKGSARGVADLASSVVGAAPDVATGFGINPVLWATGKPTIPSATNALRSYFDKITEGTPVDTQETAPYQRAVGRIGRFIGGGIGFGGALKGVGAVAGAAGAAPGVANTLNAVSGLNTGRDLIRLGGAAVGSEGARQLAGENSTIAPILGALIGGMAPDVVEGAYNTIRSPAGPINYATANAVRSLTKATPDELNQSAIQDAKDLGIPLPASARTSNPRIQNLENLVSSTQGVGGRDFQDLLNKTKQSSLDAYKDVLSSVSQKEIEDPTSVSAAIQGAINRRAAELEDIKSGLYSDVYKYIPPGEKTVPSNTIQYLDDMANKLANSTILPSDPKREAINYMVNLSEKIGEEGEHTGGAVDVSKLVGLKQDVNASWRDFKGPKGVLKGITGALKQDLSDYGETNPDFINSLNAADKSHTDMIANFKNKFIDKQVLNNAEPSKIISMINSPEDISRIGKALEGVTEGTTFADIKRAKLQQILDKKIINDNGLSFGSFVSELNPNNPEKTAMIKALVGQDQYDKLMKLRNVSNAIASGRNRFLNTSKTADSIITSGAIGIGASGLWDALRGNFRSALSKIGIASSPYVVSKIMTNQEIMDELLNTSKAIQSGNINSAAVASTRLNRAVRNAGMGYLISDQTQQQNDTRQLQAAPANH